MNKNNKILKSLTTREQRLEFFATANRVTIGTVTTMIDTTPGHAIFKESYVAKIRGCVVGNPETYKHESAEKARAYGHDILKAWQREYVETKKSGQVG